jgi:hypothetical protein
MRMIVINNIDLMSDAEERELIDTLNKINVEFSVFEEKVD